MQPCPLHALLPHALLQSAVERTYSMLQQAGRAYCTSQDLFDGTHFPVLLIPPTHTPSPCPLSPLQLGGIIGLLGGLLNALKGPLGIIRLYWEGLKIVWEWMKEIKVGPGACMEQLPAKPL